MINKLLNLDLDSFRKRFVDEKFKYFFQFKVLCLILGSVSLFMGFVNLFTHKTTLMIATLSFSVICYVNYAIMYFIKKSSFINYVIFDISVIGLFIYFLITGGTAGFSPYWILLLPTCGMSFLGKKRGFLLSAFFLLAILFILWTPFGRTLLIYSYTVEFCMRFPIVYIAFFAIGYCFELLRSMVYNEMLNTQRELADIAEKDALTGLKNRFWFNKRFFEKYDNKILYTGSLALLIDIDSFKNVNDVYGHLAGDEVICRVSDTIRNCLDDGDMLCRWGGEEFFAFIPSCDINRAVVLCETIRKSAEDTNYEYDEKRV